MKEVNARVTSMVLTEWEDEISHFERHIASIRQASDSIKLCRGGSCYDLSFGMKDATTEGGINETCIH